MGSVMCSTWIVKDYGTVGPANTVEEGRFADIWTPNNGHLHLRQTISADCVLHTPSKGPD